MSASVASDRRSPGAGARVWVLLGRNAGDNQQCLIIAEQLGVSFEPKVLDWSRWPERRMRRRWLWLRNLPAIPADLSNGSALEPPWPDLVIAGEKRTVPVARWVRRQAGRRCSLVVVGTPHIRPRRSDLLVVGATYELPLSARMVRLDAPLVRAIEPADPDQTAAWQQRLQGLPRPWNAVLVGGQATGYRFDASVGHQLVAAMERLSNADGCVHLITTSRRTSPEVVQVLRQIEPEGRIHHHLHVWQAGQELNPYRVFLGSADTLLVTGDSASMMTEACQTGRPVFIIPLPRRGRRAEPGVLAKWLRARRSQSSKRLGLLARLERTLGFLDWVPFDNDLAHLHARLARDGYARILAGDAGNDLGGWSVPGDFASRREVELREVVDRIRRLLP